MPFCEVSGRSALGWAITSTYRLIPANKRAGLVQDNIQYGSLGVPVIYPDVTAAAARDATPSERAAALRTTSGLLLRRFARAEEALTAALAAHTEHRNAANPR